jgi:ATP-dependent RNA helicase SUPV3L1/SUV3
MAMRFPEVYRDMDGAIAESRRLNEWIEAVLSARPTGRTLGVAEGAEAAGVVGQRERSRRGGPKPRPPGAGRQPGRRAGAARGS